MSYFSVGSTVDKLRLVDRTLTNMIKIKQD